MGRLNDVVEKLKKRTGNFTYAEAEWLVKRFGYHIDNGGKTTGSSMMFVNDETGDMIRLHRPHPGNNLKQYQQDQIISHLKEKGLIE